MNTANNINLHYRSNSVKINDQIFQKIEKNPVFGLFWTKKNFPENPALSRTTSCDFLALCQISEKTNDAIPRKRLNRRMDRPYFIGPFPPPPGVQKLPNPILSTNANTY